MTEGQTELEITVTQGEDSQPEFVNKIATHKFELPPDRPAKCPIKVTYKYDVNQRMQCKFHDLESDRVLEIEFCLDEDGQLNESDKCQNSKQLELLKVQ